MLNKDNVKEIFNYDKDTGLLTWRISLNRRIRPGQEAGTVNGSGYRHVKLQGKMYKAHRIAFLYMLGEIPTIVDHKDRNKLNNAWANLRAATRSQNGYNQGVSKSSSTGLKGVYKDRGRYSASLRHEGTRIYLGCFSAAEEASAAYEQRAKELHHEFYYRKGK
jgi:hypothetical protein